MSHPPPSEPYIQCQLQEIEALSSIYGEEMVRVSLPSETHHGLIVVRIELEEVDKKEPPAYSPLIVCIELPRTYLAPRTTTGKKTSVSGAVPPKNVASSPRVWFEYNMTTDPQSPQVFLAFGWVTAEFEQKATEEMQRLFDAADPEQEILFDWVEWVRTHVVFPRAGTLRDETAAAAQDRHASDKEKARAVLNSPPASTASAATTKVMSTATLSADDVAERWRAIGVRSGEPIVDRKSVFQAHVIPVKSVEEVKASLAALYLDAKIARATHNMYAYRIIQVRKLVNGKPVDIVIGEGVSGGSAGGTTGAGAGAGAGTGGAGAASGMTGASSSSSSSGVAAVVTYSTSIIADNDDDGEDAAGGRLSHLLDVTKAENVLVVVSRWYGGVQLGPDRFWHINNAARMQLDACGYIKKGKEAGGGGGGGGSGGGCRGKGNHNKGLK